jgi:hypothetical protein
VARNTFIEALLCKNSEGYGEMLHLVFPRIQLVRELRRRANLHLPIFVPEKMDIFEEFIFASSGCFWLKTKRGRRLGNY